MPSVRPDNPPAHQVIKRRRTLCKRATVSKPARKSRAAELIAELLKDRDPPDKNELRCFDLIRRFHRWGSRDMIRGLRQGTVPVVSSDGHQCVGADGQPIRQRIVWELACFPSPTGPQWKLVTWCIDDEAVFFQPMPSREAAARAFREALPPISHSTQ